MQKIDTLHLDFETFSEAKLKDVGPWAYSMHPSTEVLMFSWSINDGPVNLWVNPEKYPDWVFDLNRWLKSEPYAEFYIKAHNAFFEKCIMRNVLKWRVPGPEFWKDTAAKAAVLGLPRDLGGLGDALGLPDEHLKDKKGKNLIQFLCKPYKGKRRAVKDHPDNFKALGDYCVKDTISEIAIDKKLPEMPPYETKIYELDQAINMRGVRFDVGAVRDAVAIIDKARAKAAQKVEALTLGGVDNPNSRNQFLEYAQQEYGIGLENTQGEYLRGLLKTSIPSDLKELIRLRVAMTKTSLVKYSKLLSLVDGDRAHGLLRYHGASTGRWSGNLFQPQNLPRPSFKDTDTCVRLFKHRDPELIEKLYGCAFEALSSCLRAMIIPSNGCRLIVSDFAQIESRVLAWIASAFKKLRAFELGHDVYKLNACDVYGVDYDAVTDPQRTIGKVVELGCGYQGAYGAFDQFQKIYGLSLPKSQVMRLIAAWRDSNPEIVGLWGSLEDAAISAVKNKGSVQKVSFFKFKYTNDFLWCKLPSGRFLSYHRPKVEVGSRGEKLTFWGVNSLTRKYEKLSTYGGKLAENVTQAVSRDFMVEAMFRLEKAGYPIVLTVHDEIVADVPIMHGSLKEFNQLMCELPSWASGIPIKADGYEAERYRK
jgi:DNA polymerase